MNLATQLLHSLPQYLMKDLEIIVGEASKQDIPLFVVGGGIRDFLLGIPVSDIDLVVEGNAVEFALGIKKRYGGSVTTSRFLTATWLRQKHSGSRRDKASKSSDKLSIDLITARSETYKHPGSLPVVKQGSIHEDLRRRDFTINTLAVRMNGWKKGELLDECSGLSDLNKGLVRVLHPRSFIDDPTRLIRAVRYEQRYGFNISPETLSQINGSLWALGHVSGYRLRCELDALLSENTSGMITRLIDLGIAAAVHESLKCDNADTRMRAKAKIMDSKEKTLFGWILWLMELREEEILSIGLRLRFSKDLLRKVLPAAKLYRDIYTIKDLKPSKCVDYLDKIPVEAIHAVRNAIEDESSRYVLDQYLDIWRHKKPYTTGRTLINLGLLPGPGFQKILSKLREAWLDGCVGSEDDEKKLLTSLLNK